METETARLETRVRGRVQGVGFRAFVRQHARRQGLSGWTRNEADGSVYVVAEGPRPALDALVDALHHGPAGAAVREVQRRWGVPAGDLPQPFEVRL